MFHFSLRLRCIFLSTLAMVLVSCGKEETRGASQSNRESPILTPMQRLEVELLEGTNETRTDPLKSVRAIEPILNRFDGVVLKCLDDVLLRTQEGRSVVEEALAALKAAVPVGPLVRNSLLDQSARDHQRDQEQSGMLGHTGSDNSTPFDRIGRYASYSRVGENISYGIYGGTGGYWMSYGLFIDDGVADRGHRENILDPRFTDVGVACGPHPHYKVMCVMNFGAGVRPQKRSK